MRRSAFIHLCLLLTIGAVVTAIGLRLYRDPSKAIGGDTFALLSPIFFGMAAKKATRFGKAAVVVALIGLVFAGAALAAVLTK